LVSLISWQSEKGNAKPIASAPPFPHRAQARLTEKPPRPSSKIGNNDQSQSNQSSIIEMLVDWLFEKNEHCEQREPTATENSRIFTYLDSGELPGLEVHLS
jgi:hypothetical protein